MGGCGNADDCGLAAGKPIGSQAGVAGDADAADAAALSVRRCLWLSSNALASCRGRMAGRAPLLLACGCAATCACGCSALCARMNAACISASAPADASLPAPAPAPLGWKHGGRIMQAGEASEDGCRPSIDGVADMLPFSNAPLLASSWPARLVDTCTMADGVASELASGTTLLSDPSRNAPRCASGCALPADSPAAVDGSDGI